MMPRTIAALVLFSASLVATVTTEQLSSFSYLGIGLKTSVASLAPRYPHSQRTASVIYVAAEDAQDHISAIELSARRVRIAFEREIGGRLEYPPCDEIETRLAKEFGPPQSIRRYDEERTRHADRYWSSSTEELTLVCFNEVRGRLIAEAVIIAPR
jgi:hypothetical protein